MSKLHLILERQWLHALLLVLLLIGVALSSNLDDMGDGALWGISTTQWFWLAIALAIAHQVFVWFCWRTQLHGGLLDRIFGNLSYPGYIAANPGKRGLVDWAFVHTQFLERMDPMPARFEE